MNVSWIGWWFLLEVNLSGALKVEKGLEDILLPLGSINGDRWLKLGPGTSIYCFPPVCLTLEMQKEKELPVLQKADFILCHGATCKVQKVLVGWWERAGAGWPKALWDLQAVVRRKHRILLQILFLCHF